MSYYQGDYYQGDYYQGDPFLGALIGMGATWLGKKLLGKAASSTAIATTGAGALVTGAATGVAGMAAGSMIPRIAKSFTEIRTPGGGVFRPLRILPGGVPAYTPPGAAAGCGCPTGFHMNKSVSRAKATYGAPPGTICIRNRSMNVANPRALRRGLRRVVGFGKLASRTRKSLKAAARSV